MKDGRLQPVDVVRKYRAHSGGQLDADTERFLLSRVVGFYNLKRGALLILKIGRHDYPFKLYIWDESTQRLVNYGQAATIVQAREIAKSARALDKAGRLLPQVEALAL